MRTFDHTFEPASANPAGSTVQLSTTEIEDAGIYEVLQTPGAALGSWKILDALLISGHSEFIFHEPLGHSREVKTALSGLFGRFVARAYLTRYLGFTHFAHITKPPMRLLGPMKGRVVRQRGKKGDLPDWVVWNAPASQLGIAEAKGCHSAMGPQDALERAWIQAQRVKVELSRKTVALKRYAIATRWSASTSMKPIIAVHDPEEEGDATPRERAKLGIGIARLHFAALLRPLGHIELADALVATVKATSLRGEQDGIKRASNALAESRNHRIARKGSPGETADQLIGGFVTRAGPIDRVKEVAIDDQNTLVRLELRPVFVGVERDILAAAIKGDVDDTARPDLNADGPRTGAFPTGQLRRDRTGTWLIRLGENEFEVV